MPFSDEEELLLEEDNDSITESMMSSTSIMSPSSTMPTSYTGMDMTSDMSSGIYQQGYGGMNIGQGQYQGEAFNPQSLDQDLNMGHNYYQPDNYDYNQSPIQRWGNPNYQTETSKRNQGRGGGGGGGGGGGHSYYGGDVCLFI